MQNMTPKMLLNMVNDDLSQFSFQIEQCRGVAPFAKEMWDAHRYPLMAGGKHVRPLLVLLTAGSVGGNDGVQVARKSALAVELTHTYSLVHDDLPSMDNDDFRRGLPTTHKVFGEGKALLVGDGLLTQAFATLAATPFYHNHSKHFTSFLVETLAQCAGAEGMIWGQWLDIALTGPLSKNLSWEVLELIHRNKTGKLIGACLELGFICGLSQLNIEISDGVIKEFRQKIREAGVLIGLSFQIMDDILDATKSSAQLGKTAGKDEKQNKMTAIRLLGLQKSEEVSYMYTKQALTLLKNIFMDEVLLHHSFSNVSDFQAELFKYIDMLLSRSS